MKKKILNGLNFGDYEFSGNSFSYNQLFNNTRHQDGTFPFTKNGVTFSYENGLIILNGTSTANIGVVGYGNIKQGNKYFRRNLKSNGFALYGTYEINDESIVTANSANMYLSITILANRTFNNTPYLGMCIDLTQLEQALGTTINTLEDFYATEVGKQVKNGAYLPYSATNTIYNATSPFRFVRADGREKTFAPTTPIVLRSAGNTHDTWRNTNGKVKRNVGNYTFTGDESWTILGSGYRNNAFMDFANKNASFKNGKTILSSALKTEDNFGAGATYTNAIWLQSIPDYPRLYVNIENVSGVSSLAINNFMRSNTLNYELATPTTELANSLALPIGIAKCYDANGVELTITERKN